MDLKPYIAELINRRDLTFEQAQDAMDVIMSGAGTQAQIGSYLTALRMKGETAAEIAGSAASMRSHVVPVAVESADGKLYDIVGTGGDGAHTFNISTTTAFVVAGAGKTVAKHGNRAASSRSGAADVLTALGGNLDISADQVEKVIAEVGIGFLYAIKHHPAMRYAIGPRRELGQRTIFNILGPLTNPASATHYMLGVFAPEYTEPMAETLGKLGAKAAFVVHGADRLDELSVTGVNRVSHWHNRRVVTYDLDPVNLGLPRADKSELVGGLPEENAAITRGVLSGKVRGAKRDIVLLNAAGALCVETGDFVRGLEEAEDAIDSGAALQKLDAWIEATNSV